MTAEVAYLAMALWGACYVAGNSRISLPFREGLSKRPAWGWFMALIECPACQCNFTLSVAWPADRPPQPLPLPPQRQEQQHSRQPQPEPLQLRSHADHAESTKPWTRVWSPRHAAGSCTPSGATSWARQRQSRR